MSNNKIEILNNINSLNPIIRNGESLTIKVNFNKIYVLKYINNIWILQGG